MFTMTPSMKLKRQRGITLMEVIAALAVGAVVIAGALALYSSSTSSSNSTQLIADINSVRGSIKQLYQGQGTYGTAGTVLNNILVASKQLPTTIRVDTTTTPNTLTSVANGTVTVTAQGSSFTMAWTNLSPDLCMPILTSSQGWTSVQVGANTAITAFPISPSTASTQCVGTNTITFAGS